MSVPIGEVQATFAATLVDEWVRGGVTQAVVSPGSRSTPIAVALYERPEIALHVRLDERSACFYAIGLAAASGRPAIICTTSGTAAAELHAGIVEARQQGVPLIVCTADRPPELQDVGAPQAIDQVGIFGPAVRWSCNPGVPDAAATSTWRSLGSRLVAEAAASPLGPGPVHANLAFREPLVGKAGALPPGRPGGRPWHLVQRLQRAHPVHAVRSGQSAERTLPNPRGTDGHADVGSALASRAGWRGVLVAGAGAGDPETVLTLAARIGWPVLADPRSGCRLDRPGVVAAPDAFLRSARVADALRPQVIVQLGAPWASKVVAGFIRDSGAAGTEVWAVDAAWRWRDPDRVVGNYVHANPTAFASAVVEALSANRVEGDARRWLEQWIVAENAAQDALDRALCGSGASGLAPLDEPTIARRVLGGLDPSASVVVSSSMPVRDLEWYAPKLDKVPRVWANRGANGIDGVASTAVGMAAAGEGPVLGILGDLAFLHDLSALVHPVEATPGHSPCTLLVIDNDGGGIFSFLPQAGHSSQRDASDHDRYETLFGTPMGQSVPEVASGLGAEVAGVRNCAELDQAVAAASSAGTRLRVVHAPVPSRMENVAIHNQVHSMVVSAVEKHI